MNIYIQYSIFNDTRYFKDDNNLKVFYFKLQFLEKNIHSKEINLDSNT